MAALEEVAVAAERYTGAPIKMDQMDETQPTKCQIPDTPKMNKVIWNFINGFLLQLFD